MTEKQKTQAALDLIQKQIESTSVKFDEAMRTSPLNISDIHHYSGVLLGQYVTLNEIKNEKKQATNSRVKTEA